MYHKVGDITSDLTDTQIAQMMEMEFGCNMQALVLAALQTMDDNSNAGIVSAVEKGITNKGTFLTQKAKAGAESALSDLDVSASVVSGIKSSAVDLTSYATDGAQKAIAKVDFQNHAASGAADALLAFDFKTPAKTGALSALGTYDFVASACEGSKQAIDAKKSVFNAEAKSGAKSAISECGSDITGYAQAAIDNKKHVITSAAEQAITNKKVSSQEEVRVAILSAYNSYALALDSAKSSFEEVVSSVINQTINLNDATVQYQVLLLSASEAAERLAKTAEVFKDVVFTAERYASTVTDVLAIQRLQENVLDTTKAAINSISQLRNEWADDRKELFETMSDVRKLQDIGTKFDMAYKSLQVALGLTERVQEGIKMKSPEVVY
jgi:predicted  nucleic acid-binding Zn-ribbon protein